MIGITENALGQNLNSTQYRQALEQLYHQQQNLTDITNSLLLLSDYKIVTERDYPRVRLDELLFRSVEIIQALFPHSMIEVNFEGEASSEESLMVNANVPLLTMAFNNLLKNALQYSTDKKAVVVIHLLDNTKKLIFKNIGTPLLPTEEQMLFTPFYRASNSTAIRGNGLGLPLVKQIAELHKATVCFYREGEYNVFCFTFGV
jgi:signal transduction histidine kinase